MVARCLIQVIRGTVVPDKSGKLYPAEKQSMRRMGNVMRSRVPGLMQKWRDPNARRSTNVEFAVPDPVSQRDIDEKMILNARGREWVLNSPAYSAARKRLKHYSESQSPKQRKAAGLSYTRPKKKAGLATPMAPFGSID